MIQQSRTYHGLALAGTLPFFAAAVLATGNVRPIDWLPPAAMIASSYGLAILCFLCGAHWATYLYRRNETPFNLFLISNVVVVIIWLTYLLTGSSSYTLGSQILAFAYLLYIDYRLFQVDLISRHYFSVRLQATVVAVAALAVVLYSNLA